MKEVLYSRQALLQLEENISALVAEGYFSDEEYAVQYMSDIVHYFALNLQNLVTTPAPTYFHRYRVADKDMKYARYRKSSHTTWYAFYEELEAVYSIDYLGNNHYIGHLLEINIKDL